MALSVIVQLIGLVSMGFNVTGHGYAMATPQKRNNPVRGLAIATFITSATGAGLTLIANIVSLIVGVEYVNSGYSPTALLANNANGVMGLLAGLVTLAAAILFFFYLRCLCLAMRRDGLASTVTTLMIATGGLILVCLLIFFMMMFMLGASFNMAMGGNAISGARTAQGTALIGMALFCIAGIAGLGLFVWYIVVLHQVRDAVTTYIRKL